MTSDDQPNMHLQQLLLASEEWLMQRVLMYAREHEYTQYTSTLAEAWRLSISELSRSIIEALTAHPTPPELHPDEDYSRDPIAQFGLVEARRHRTRGISLPMFLGLLKYYRQSYIDLVAESDLPLQERTVGQLFVDRCFDRIEIGFTDEWLRGSESDRLQELQAANRRMTNEKNKYLTIFESLHEPAILLDEKLCIVNMNHAAQTLFVGAGVPGAIYYSEQATEQVLPWLPEALAHSNGNHESGFEMTVDTVQGARIFRLKIHAMLDVSEKFRGSVVLLDDVTARKKAEQKLSEYNAELYAKNRQLEEDLSLARDIQLSFLPSRYPTFPHDVSVSGSALRFYDLYRPAQTLGGDFFDVLAISDSEAGVLICDVMGHGVQGALVAAVIRGLLPQLRPLASRPGPFLTEMNRALLNRLNRPLSPVLTTAFYLVIDTKNSELRYSNAGHPSPIWLRRAARDVEHFPSREAANGPALGLFREVCYHTGMRCLNPADLIVLFTDGLFEVMGQTSEEYGLDRLLNAARQQLHLAPGDLLHSLLAEAQQFSAHGEFDDDICLVGVEYAHPISQSTR